MNAALVELYWRIGKHLSGKIRSDGWGQNADVVEYALSRTLSPALVADYETQLPDKALLRAKLDEFYGLMEGGPG